ncbi:MAG: DUF2796 domain-containing protein [Pseudomonadota bacterium]
MTCRYDTPLKPFRPVLGAGALLASAMLIACSPAQDPVEPQTAKRTEPVVTPSADTIDTGGDQVGLPDDIETPDIETSDMAAEDSAAMPDAANDGDAATVRQADSHVHGAAALSMALDGERLSVELESPLYNILGFEHAPDTAEQKDAVVAAQSTLSDPAALFAFSPEAECMADPVSPVALFEEGNMHDHDHNDEHRHDDGHSHDDDHEHSDDHDHEGDHAHDHDDGDHAHDDHDHDDAHVHRDVLLSYEYTCARPDALGAVELKLFDRFDELSEVELVYLGPNAQTGRTVSRGGARRVELGG